MFPDPTLKHIVLSWQSRAGGSQKAPVHIPFCLLFIHHEIWDDPLNLTCEFQCPHPSDGVTLLPCQRRWPAFLQSFLPVGCPAHGNAHHKTCLYNKQCVLLASFILPVIESLQSPGCWHSRALFKVLVQEKGMSSALDLQICPRANPNLLQQSSAIPGGVYSVMHLEMQSVRVTVQFLSG